MKRMIIALVVLVSVAGYSITSGGKNNEMYSSGEIIEKSGDSYITLYKDGMFITISNSEIYHEYSVGDVVEFDNNEEYIDGNFISAISKDGTIKIPSNNIQVIDSSNDLNKQ